jgi:hypothetical protein
MKNEYLSEKKLEKLACQLGGAEVFVRRACQCTGTSVGTFVLVTGAGIE